MIEDTERKRDVSAAEIARRVQAELAAPELAPIRKAFAYLLDSVGRQRTGQ